MDASMITPTQAIAEENRRLKTMFAELSMQNDLLKEALGKIDRPSVARKANACICRGSKPRDGRECSGAARDQHSAGLPDFRGQGDLLSLWPKVAGRER